MSTPKWTLQWYIIRAIKNNNTYDSVCYIVLIALFSQNGKIYNKEWCIKKKANRFQIDQHTNC